MTDNMESLLLGGSDSSDDDEGLEEVTAGTAVPAAAAVAAVAQPRAPVPAPAPVHPPSHSEINSRLKSLYSPANNNKVIQQPPPQVTSPPLGRSMSASATQPPTMTHLQSSSSVSRLPQVGAPHPSPLTQPQAPSSTMQPLVPNIPTQPRQPRTSHHPSSVPRSHHSSSSATSSSSRPTGRDPFEPTPLTTMMQRHTVKSSSGGVPMPAAPMPPQPATRTPSSTVAPMIHTSLPSHRSTSSGGSTSTQATIRASNVSQSTSSSSSPSLEREAKNRKERFLMFTRVLMKYLEQKDPEMHARAKAVIQECAEKNKKKEAGYESITASMHTRLRQTVGDAYWKRAESYLSHFLKQKNDIGVRSKRQTQPPSSTTQQHHQQQQQQQQQQTAHQQQLHQQQLAAQERQRQQRAAAIAAQQAALEKQKKEQKEREIARKRAEELEQQRKKKQQQQELIRKQMQQQEAQKKHAAKIAQINRENAAQIAKINASLPQRAVPDSKKRSVSAPKLEKRKSSSARDLTIEQQQPPREYSELMETLDHAITYDCTTAGLLLQNKSELHLVDEQRKLLYGKAQPKPVEDFGHPSRGWNQRNVLSVRAAWSRVRLQEQLKERKEAQQTNPSVAGISLPRTVLQQQQIEQQKPHQLSAKVTWFNEDRAEQDSTLELLSEATQIYLKHVMEKALQCARQRQNLAGIRLWHLQHAQTKPPLSLRLGCDVSRQVAQASGNAAKICKRMEEALERQKVPAAHYNLRDPKVLEDTSSMGDLALRPQLATGAEEADFHAKRSFEVSGGKDTADPPLGRVPKRAKITAHDFMLGMEFVSFPHKREAIAASTFSS